MAAGGAALGKFSRYAEPGHSGLGDSLLKRGPEKYENMREAEAAGGEIPDRAPLPAQGLRQLRHLMRCFRTPLVRRQLLLPRSLYWDTRLQGVDPARACGSGITNKRLSSGQMIPLCCRPALSHFLPSPLRSAFKGARSARPSVLMAALSGARPPRDAALRGAALLGAPRPQPSTRRLSRGCRGASNAGAQAS